MYQKTKREREIERERKKEREKQIDRQRDRQAERKKMCHSPQKSHMRACTSKGATDCV